MDKEKKHSQEPTQKLAVILFADIQGYTSFMQKDAKYASTLLKRFHQVIEESVPAFQGKIGNFYGDGALCVFDSPGSAVEAAEFIQKSFLEDPNVPVRIGIHSGMVTIDSGKVYGDSVNVASRIESIAVPGSVLMSKRVRDEIKNNPSLPLTQLGEIDFKNVVEPISVYALNKEGVVVPKRKELKGKIKEKAGTVSGRTIVWLALLTIILLGSAYYFYSQREETYTGTGKSPQKSIAVLPFRDLSPDKDQEYFADGIVEAIRSKLAQVSNLRVTSMTSALIYRNNPKTLSEIASELNVDHVLEGTVYRDANKVRIIAQLIEAKSDEHLWTGTFDEEIEDIFEIQSRIASNVTQGLQASLTPTEKVRLDLKITADIKAYDLFLSATKDVRNFSNTQDTNYVWTAFNKINRALELDPQFDQLYHTKARLWYIRYYTGYGDRALDSSKYYLQTTLKLNPENSDAYSLNGRIYMRQGLFELAMGEAEKALEISPNNIEAITLLAEYYSISNEDLERAIPYLLKAIVLSPAMSNDPEDNSGIYSRIGYLYLITGQPEKAKEYFKKRYELFPQNVYAINSMRMINYFTGEYQEAIDYGKGLLEIAPNNMSVLDNYGNSLIGLGKYEEALEVFTKMKEIVDAGFDETANTRSFRHRLGFVLWQVGKKEEATNLFKDYEEQMLEYIKDGTIVAGQEYDLAGIYAFTGQKEKAYDMLDKMPFWYVTNYLINYDPLFDPIREEPAFQQVLERISEKTARLRSKLQEYESDGELSFSLDD